MGAMDFRLTSGSISSKALQQARRRARFAKAFTPCVSCKAWKRRCDGLEPCSACIKYSKASSCFKDKTAGQQAWPDSQVVELNIERPLEYAYSVRFDNENPVLDIAEGLGWATIPIRRFLTFGSNHQRISRIILALPSWVHSEIGSALSIIQGMARNSLQQVLKPNVSDLSAPPLIADTSAEFWKEDSSFGLHVMTFDPNTRHRSNVFVNSFTARLFGMHREEFMSRTANYDIKISMTDLDGLRLMLYFIVKASFSNGSMSSESIYRMVYGSGASAQSVLISLRMCPVVDSQGNMLEMRRTYRVITADEYDAAVATRPECCIAYSMGDYRTGRQLLAGAAQDSEWTMEAIVAAGGNALTVLGELSARAVALAQCFTGGGVSPAAAAVAGTGMSLGPLVPHPPTIAAAAAAVGAFTPGGGGASRRKVTDSPHRTGVCVPGPFESRVPMVKSQWSNSPSQRSNSPSRSPSPAAGLVDSSTVRRAGSDGGGGNWSTPSPCSPVDTPPPAPRPPSPSPPPAPDMPNFSESFTAGGINAAATHWSNSHWSNSHWSNITPPAAMSALNDNVGADPRPLLHRPEQQHLHRPEQQHLHPAGRPEIGGGVMWAQGAAGLCNQESAAAAARESWAAAAAAAAVAAAAPAAGDTEGGSLRDYASLGGEGSGAHLEHGFSAEQSWAAGAAGSAAAAADRAVRDDWAALGGERSRAHLEEGWGLGEGGSAGSEGYLPEYMPPGPGPVDPASPGGGGCGFPGVQLETAPGSESLFSGGWEWEQEACAAEAAAAAGLGDGEGEDDPFRNQWALWDGAVSPCDESDLHLQV